MRESYPPGERTADVVVVGGGVGGCAAALAMARNGLNVLMTEETDWPGGQLTQQAVPPDEHPWIEQFGCTRSYRDYRRRVRDYYRRNTPLSRAALDEPFLNPGNGSVSRLCHEPKVGLAVLREMFYPHESAGRLTVLSHHDLDSAAVDGDVVQSIRMRDRESGRYTVVNAPYFVDATELGDLLPLAGVEFVTGSESRRETGEPHASEEARPDNQQSFTCCFAMDHLDGEDHTIERPKDYSFWRDYVPDCNPSWTGRWLSLTGCHVVTLEPRDYCFDPVHEASGAVSGLWIYRRILDRSNYICGSYASDICLVNWPMNDYLLGNLIGAAEEQKQYHIEQAKQLGLSLLYWLQTEAPRPDGGTGWPGLRLRADVVGTEDGFAKHPYIRESRRIRAETTVLEQHVGTEARMRETGFPIERVNAMPYPDSVGIGSYRIDLHPSSGGDNYIDISSLPFQIPLGALLPQRVENLLPACKNIGVTHITNGCYRLHPVEWNIGESAGLLLAYCARRKLPPRAIRGNPAELADFQSFLTSKGVEIRWPSLTPR